LASQIDTYLTIKEPSTGLFKDKGSKFLSFAYPVIDEKEIKTLVDKLKKEYFDARHHCYAYRLGADQLIFRANDDNEPSGTAGKPILGQIISNDLTNILIVVVRYFGGTLLGTSGLINAYRNASANAISNASIIKKNVYAIYQLVFNYQQMNYVMKIVKDYDLTAFDQNFELICSLKVKIKLLQVDSLMVKFSPLSGVEATFLCNE
jgi:uncharacterized YigZ family protein